jgi:hypothetical protein
MRLMSEENAKSGVGKRKMWRINGTLLEIMKRNEVVS